jgi:hypothetical protein
MGPAAVLEADPFDDDTRGVPKRLESTVHAQMLCARHTMTATGQYADSAAAKDRCRQEHFLIRVVESFHPVARCLPGTAIALACTKPVIRTIATTAARDDMVGAPPGDPT